MVSAWNLKKSNTSFDSIDDEISAKLILLKVDKLRFQASEKNWRKKSGATREINSHRKVTGFYY